MNSTNRFILELNAPQSQISIPVMLADTARVWEITFSDNGKAYSIADGILAKIEIKRPTGTIMETFCPITGNTTVVYEFDENTAVVEGVHNCAIVLYSATKRIASAHFTMVVDARVISKDDYIISDEDFTIIQAIVQDEAVRVSNENTRIANENTRIANEETRVLNESGRVTAESERETTADNLFNRMETTIERVENKVAQGVFDGDDGFSPTITTTQTAAGHLVTITDINGEKTIEIKNGKDGAGGEIADYSISMELNRETYILTLSLKDTNGTVVSQSTVDFPIEQLVVGGSEEEGIVTLTLVNGNVITFDIGDLVDGLVSQTTFDSEVEEMNTALASINAKFDDYYTKTEIDDMIGSNLTEIDALIGG